MNADNASTVIFLHIPKTAGTSFNTALSLQYYGLPTYWIPAEDLQADGFRQLPPERRAALRLLRGHMQFGLHEFLPRAANYVSFVREPVSRILSYWQNAQTEARLEPDSPHWWMEAARTMTLEQFIAHGRDVELDNGQVRRLSGLKAPFGECHRGMLDRARQNISRHFSVVGLMGRFEESLVLMRRALGWKRPLLYRLSKVGKTTPRDAIVSPSLMGEIRRLNELDAELFAFIQEEFQKRVVAAPWMAADVRRLRRFVRTFSWLIPVGRGVLPAAKPPAAAPGIPNRPESAPAIALETETSAQTFDYCPELAAMIRTGRLVGKTGRVFEQLEALSSRNNLIILRQLMLKLRAGRTLEIGFGFGGSALMFAATHRDLGREPGSQHLVLDPFQGTVWDSCGLMALDRAGLSGYVDFRSAYSARVLPNLVEAEEHFDLIYIDGSHLFEDVFVDAYFAMRLLAPGGVVAFDDSSTPHVQKVLRFLRNSLRDVLPEMDLSGYRQDRRSRAIYLLARRMRKVQLTAFRCEGHVERAWDSPFRSF